MFNVWFGASFQQNIPNLCNGRAHEKSTINKNTIWKRSRLKREKIYLDDNIETIMEDTLSQVANIANEQKFQYFYFKKVC